MPAAESYTYDMTPPRRPGLEDLGGAAYEDNPRFPPDPVTMPNAAEHKERARNQAGLNKVCPTVLLHVTFSGVTPSLATFSAMGTQLVLGSFTVARVADGHTRITWSTSDMPTQILPAMASLVVDADATICCFPSSSGTGVEVKTAARDTGTLTPYNFLVTVY